MEEIVEEKREVMMGWERVWRACLHFSNAVFNTLPTKRLIEETKGLISIK
jgi:hypothetical protein